MTNGKNADYENIKDTFSVFTANEVANVLGEKYRKVVKVLNTLATEGKIEVTEKLVNNRALKGYCLSISSLQEVKNNFISEKHFKNAYVAPVAKMLANAENNSNIGDNENENAESVNVKFYEVVQENSDLKKEVEKLKQDIQSKNNENVRLDADLSMARSELKFIEDKSKSMESAYSEQKLLNEKLNKSVNIRNYVIIGLSAVLLVIIVIVCCYFAFRG